METPVTSTSSSTLSPIALEQLLFHGKMKELIKALKPLSDKERRTLSKTAFEIYTVVKNKWEYRPISKKHEHLASKLNILNTKAVFKRAQCAVLGVCPLSKTRNVDYLWYQDNGSEQWAFTVLKDRNPDWLNAWVEHKLENNVNIFLWQFVRELIDLGLIEKPTSVDYLRSMVLYFNTWHSRKKNIPIPTIADRLVSIPDTLEDIYRLFEIETDAFKTHYLESWKNKPENFQTWTTAVAILCKRGYLDRNRILDTSLKGLGMGFSDLQLSGFIKVHNHLKPTSEEIYVRQSEYINLLHIGVSRVSDFVLKKLRIIEKLNLLDASSFLENIPTVAHLPTKGPIKSALKLAKRTLSNQPEYSSLGVTLGHKALSHESPDIQDLAYDLLCSVKESITEVQKEALIGVLPTCSPSIQIQLSDLLDIPVEQTEKEALKTEDVDLLVDRISHLPQGYKQKFGLQPELFLSQFPPPLDFDILDSQVLSTVSPIHPIQTLQELIDSVSHAVEIVDSADEVERIMDGISRLGNQKPEDFALRTAALLKRVNEPRFSESNRMLISGWGRLSLAFKDLLLTWLTGEYHHSAPSFYDADLGFLHIHINRLKELTRRVYKGQSGPLFATPTHEHGWIDPIQLVARLRHLEQDWKYSRRYDITQSLLRIAPDRREQALALRSNIPGPINKLVCWALGADEEPSSKDKNEYELWVAAGRARSPQKSLVEAYKIFRVKDNLPDSALPATYTWKSSFIRSTSNPRYSYPKISMSHNQGEIFHDTSKAPNSILPDIKDIHTFLKTSLQRLVSLPSTPSWKRIPTAAMHAQNKAQRYYAFSSWQIQWMQYVWPLHQDSCFVRGIQRMILRIDENTTSTIQLSSFLEPAFQVYRPWTEMTHLAVWIGIISKDVELQNVAIEALIEGIFDARAHPDPLANVLLQLAEGTWIKLNRLTAALEQVAAISELHQYVICSILDQFAAGLPELPKNAHHVLQLLLELHTGLSLPVPESTKEALQNVKGKGKAAQLAHAICQLTNNREMSVIFASSIHGRLSLIDSLLPSSQLCIRK